MKMKIQIFLLIVIFSIYYSDCDNYCKKTAEHPKVNKTSEHSEYKVSSVDRQFIITFKGWFTDPARKGYITSALQRLGYNYENLYSVIPRDNPMAGYPSDFDLIMFSSSDDIVSRSIDLLLNHPLVKSVTPQKMVTRHLSNADNDDEHSDNDQ